MQHTNSCSSSPRALIVDDVASNRAILRAVVQRECGGIAIDEASDAAHALSLVSSDSREYDFILLDLNVSAARDGLELLRFIRSSPSRQLTPVLLLSSSNADDGVVADALREGADDYVARPVTAQVLAARVARLRRTRERYVELHRGIARVEESAAARDVELRSVASAQKLARTKLPYSRDGLYCSASVLPAGAVSGDACDVVTDRQGRSAIVAIDVAGHGGGTAIIASAVMGALRYGLSTGLEFSAVFSQTEEAIFSGSDAYEGEGRGPIAVSLCIARIDCANKTLEFANAAMPDALLFEDSRVRARLRSTSPPLGLVYGRRPIVEHYRFSKGAALAMVSDGLAGHSGDGLDEFVSRFGASLVCTSLARAKPKELDALVYEFASSRSSRLDDDTTLVLAAMLGEGAAR
ncbi:MAG: fused response regulator/phosphatase [Myxococcales bacterium]|nr:fused response regulator/phosphatase [Myxococcales bacterium]